MGHLIRWKCWYSHNFMEVELFSRYAVEATKILHSLLFPTQDSFRHIRRSSLDDMAISISAALAQSHFNSQPLLIDIPAFNHNKLQWVQNLAVRFAINDWHMPTQELFMYLHRLQFTLSKVQDFHIYFEISSRKSTHDLLIT